MNVYVRELVSALAQAGVPSDVYTRRWARGLPDVVEVEPGLRVLHVSAGPVRLAKEALPETVHEFVDGVAHRLEPDVDAVHANYWLSGLAGQKLKQWLGFPLVSTFHTLARVKAETGDPEPERRVQAESAVIGCSDVILASSPVEVHQLNQLYGADPQTIELVPPGVDHAFFSPGRREGARRALASLNLGTGPMLLFVGRIQPLKRLDVALGTLAQLDDPSAVLVVVGGASGAEGLTEVRRIHRLASSLGVSDQVRFVDPQPHHLLSTYYRAADVVIVPSRSESFGLVALEAAACGTPVVAAPVGGLRTLIDHGQTGFLVEENDPAAYAAYVRKLLSDPALAARCAQAAAARARTYTWSTAAARLRRIYADLTARAPAHC